MTESPFRLRAEGQADPTPVRKRLQSGTAQQQDIWDLLASESVVNVSCEARAGTGKSSTCREAMYRQLERNPGLAIRYTVFNATNAREFAGDCPPGVETGTLHSFGLKVLGRACKSKVEKNKTYLILDETKESRELPRYIRRSIASLVSQAKNQLCEPACPELQHELYDLAIHYDINLYGQRRTILQAAVEVLRCSADLTEICDFDDMIWLPALLELPFPTCDVLYIDEAQDLNPAQHALVALAGAQGRTVIVGDRYQAIYAFRGADSQSIETLEQDLRQRSGGLDCRPLTITWRCPKSHVELAQRYVSDIEAHPDAIDGEVDHTELTLARHDYLPGDMVLCPANAPVIAEALKLIASRRPALIRGRRVGDQLLDIVRGPGKSARTIADLSLCIHHWQASELARLSGIDGVEDLIESVCDRAAGLNAVLASCDSPGQVEPAINELFTDDIPGGNSRAVLFSTIHRAKGLEADRVWIIDAPTKAPKLDWEIQQQRNLSYVALTRAKKTLTFVAMPKSEEPNRG
jgi:DNA helicase-2/ATP-dependent DNA helicase PcrA